MPGLIGGLGDAINSGLNVYMKNKQLQQENEKLAIQKMAERGQLLNAGVQTDDNNNPSYTDSRASKEGFLKAQSDYGQGQYNPTSDQSQQISAMTNAVSNKAGLGNIIQPGTSAATVSQAGVDPGAIIKPYLAGQNAFAKQQNNQQFQKQQQDNRQDFQQQKQENQQGFKGDQAAIQSANKDTQMSQNLMRLDGSLRVKDIMDKIRSGELADSDQVRHSISNEYTRLELGTQNMGLGQSERSDVIKTLEADKNNFIQRLTGIVKSGNISSDQLNQLDKEIGTLSEAQMSQYDRRHNFLKSGVSPSAASIIDQKFNPLRDQYKEKFGFWGKSPGGLITGQGGGNAQQSGQQDLMSAAQAELERRKKNK